MANQNINSHITEATADVARTIDSTSICTSTLILIAGIALFYSSFKFGPDADEMSMLCLLLGLFGSAIGMIMLAVRNTKLVYLPTGSRLRTSAIYFKRDDLAKVEQLANNTIEAAKLPQCDANGTVRIDTLSSSDGAFAASQVFMHSDFMYNPMSKIHTYTGEAAQSFISKIRHLTR